MAGQAAVVMLSTIHDDSWVTKHRRTRLVAGEREEIEKPTMIGKYNVDKGDQLMSYYGFSHRTVKWLRRAFFISENAMVNAYILDRLSVQDGCKLFRIELAEQVLRNADSHTGPPSHRLNVLPPPARLTKQHFLEKVQPCTSGRPSQRVCGVLQYESKRQENNLAMQAV